MTTAVSDKFLSEREQFTRTGVLQQHCAFHFQMPWEKYNFPQSPQWFLNVMFWSLF
jgi:hypothetical protein